jgi:DNA modification methylase
MPTNPSPHHNLRLSIIYETIDRVQPNPRDPRVYRRAERRRIASTLRRLGAVPLIVTSDRVMLSGNIWLEAAKLAGFSEVPVIVADHLTQAEGDAFMLAQVRLIERGEWDERLLGQVLRDLTLQELDFNVTITGFDPPEIDLKIAALDEPSEGPDPADEPAPPGPSVSRRGDLWILDRHRLLCADSQIAASYEVLLVGEKANIVFTDPPFNVAIAGNVSGLGAVIHREFAMASGEMSETEYIGFLTIILMLMAAHSRNGTLHYVAIDWRHMHELTVAGRKAYDSLVNLCVWSKDKGGMGSLYRSQHELFFVFKKGKKHHRNNVQLGRFGRNRTNVWSYPGVNNFGREGEEGDLLRLHPTVKPVALIVDALLDASCRGEIVLDPFMGSGSTLIAAEKVGRCARGIEIDPLYVDAAVRRWERWTGEEARLEADGRTFGEIAAERDEEAGDERWRRRPWPERADRAISTGAFRQSQWAAQKAQDCGRGDHRGLQREGAHQRRWSAPEDHQT